MRQRRDKENRKRKGEVKEGKWMLRIWEGKRDVEQKERGGKSGTNDTEGNERIKKGRVKRNAVADGEKNENDGKGGVRRREVVEER